MTYKDVEAKCLFCEATVKGNQQFMRGGGNLPALRGRIPNWLKEKPEHQWIWNGSPGYIGENWVSYDFYLCPIHKDEEHYHSAMEWAQRQLDEAKRLKETEDLETQKAIQMLTSDAIKRKSPLYQHFSEHVEVCPECAAELEQLRKTCL